MKISIKWLSDSHECETCGYSSAEGAIVEIDGQVALDLEPVAYCCGPAHYDEGTVYRRILEHLGHEVDA